MSDWTIVIASGPSLTRADCDSLRGIGYTIAVNNSVFFAPWVDELYASDGRWWEYYARKVSWFKGHCVTRTFNGPGIERWAGKGWPRTGGNSGHQGIQRAADRLPPNIAILGFDQKKAPDGKVHFHGDHPSHDGQRITRLGNANNIANWPGNMDRTAVDLKNRGKRVVNLSRDTALTCFERMSVEDFLRFELET